MYKTGVKGITLIALVVTIVVLLILATVSIQMLGGEDGIIKQAAKSKEMTDISQIQENITMAYNNAVTKKYVEGSTDFITDMKRELEKTYGTGKVDVISENGEYIITINEKVYTIDESTMKVTKKELAQIASISQTTLTLDGAYLLSATLSDGMTATSENVMWSSDNTDIATVTNEGIIKCGTETGTTKIKCKGGNKTLECIVTSTARIIDANTGANRTVNGQTVSFANPIVPEGFIAIDTDYAKWSKTEEQTDINKGLVIMDDKGNEFVWIPVENPVYDSSNVNASKIPTSSTNGSLTGYSYTPMAIKNISGNYIGILYNYNSTGGAYLKYPSGTNYQGSTAEEFHEPVTLPYGYSPDRDPTNLDIIVSILTDQEAKYSTITTFGSTMQEDYNSMIESVKKYGGFYIGRYESSLINNTTRVIAGATSLYNDSAENNWYGLYARQKRFASDNSLTSVGSSMIWGSQYDAMMNWMITRNIDVTSITLTTPEGITTSKNTARITGTAQSDKLNNIFDLLGNSLEWSLEAGSSRINRGGYYDHSLTPSNRTVFNPTSTDSSCSSRPTLYVK